MYISTYMYLVLCTSSIRLYVLILSSLSGPKIVICDLTLILATKSAERRRNIYVCTYIRNRLFEDGWGYVVYHDRALIGATSIRYMAIIYVHVDSHEYMLSEDLRHIHSYM